MSLDQAKEYLARVLPWPQDGDEPAFVNVHWKFVPKDHDGVRLLPWAGRAVRSVADAAKAVEWALTKPDTRDIYVCLSTQRFADERTGKTGFKYNAAVRSAENAVQLKALWLDVDGYKDGPTGYPTMTEAVTALGKWLADSGMPRPTMVVTTGGGLHAYWTLARALSPDEWRPLAYALVEATKRHGLKCDTGVTTDTARVLRVPDTFNRKTDTPRPVALAGARLDFDYSVERITEALKPYEVAVPAAGVGSIDTKVFPIRRAIVGGSDLEGGISTGMTPAELRACLDAIPNNRTDWIWWNSIGMRVYAASDGADYGRDEWLRWSMTNAPAGVDPKDSVNDRWDTFHSSPPTRTGAGALVNEARAALGDPKWFPTPPPPPAPPPVPGAAAPQPSPLGAVNVFGAPVATPGTAPQADLPKSYVRDAAGVIAKQIVAEDGTISAFPICAYAMTDPWLQRNPWLLHFNTVTERGRSQQIAIALEAIGTTDMRKVLQAQGLMLHEGVAKNVGEFFVSWTEKLQATKDAVVSSSPFGWNVLGGKVQGFVYGGACWSPGGELAAANPDPTTAAHYAPTGSLDAWIDAAAMVTSQGRPALDAVIASAFGAPLVRFTGQSGLLMSCFSQESGIGKSTALKIAQAVWGDPVKAVQGLSDTENSVINKIGEIRSLPLYWDEMKTEEDTRKFVNLAFRLSLGKEKSRLSRSAHQRTPGSWQTLLVSASNESVMDFIVQHTRMTTAGIYRIFEYTVPPGVNGQIEPSRAQRIIARLHDNYGQAGLKYAQFVGANHERLDQEMAEFLKNYGGRVNAQPDERFWVALVACVYMGATYSNELGLTKINTQELLLFLTNVLTSMRVERNVQPVDMKNAMNVSNVLAQFLNAMRARHTLFTDKIYSAPGRPVPGQIKVMHHRTDPNRLDGIYVHIGVDDKVLRISSTAMTDWLREHGYSRTMFSSALATEFGMQQVRGRIGTGTNFSGALEYLLEIKLANTANANFIDEG